MIRFPHAEPPAPGAAVAVAEGILWLRLPLPMALDHVNVYALEDGDGWTLVDCGLDTAAARGAWAAALAGPLAGRPVRRVIVTHHHPDHIGLAGWFQAQGAELLTTRTAWLYARMLVLDVQAEVVPAVVEGWRRAGMPAAEIARRRGERPFNFADTVAPLPLGFRRIGEGDVLAIGGRDWRVRLGQGHAPDHATLWAADSTLVLAGDQCLPGITPNVGVWPTEPEADPLAEWLTSCAALATLARGGDPLVLPGHRRPFRGMAERLEEIAAGHHAALGRLQAALAVQPLTAWECLPVLFGRPVGAAETGLALAEAAAHLNHLARRGAVAGAAGPDGAVRWHAAARSGRDSAP